MLLGNQVKEDEMDGTCSTDGRDGKCILYLVGNPERKSIPKTRHRMEDNIRMDPKEIGLRV
jgi:hypothetical protein